MNDNDRPITELFSMPQTKEEIATLEKRSFDTAQFLVASLNAYISNECANKEGRVDMHGVVAGAVATALHMIQHHVPAPLKPHVFEEHSFHMLGMASAQRKKAIYGGYVLPDMTAVASTLAYLSELVEAAEAANTDHDTIQ